MQIKEKVFEDNHPSTAKTLHNIGETLHNIGALKDSQGEYEEAIEYYTNIILILYYSQQLQVWLEALFKRQ